MSKTVRRDKLKRMVEKGLLIAKRVILSGGYWNENTEWYPAEMETEETKENRNKKNGTIYFSDWDFSNKSGRAWIDEKGIYTLHIHSNCVYELKERKNNE